MIRLAAMLYFRFTLSLRDVEALQHERGIVLVKCLQRKFGNHALFA